jgi:predicted AlkP superfamily pyrophosphatase or phosphodiesterase
VSAQKLVLCVVDSLRTDKLEQAAAEGVAPTFAALLERGVLIGDCVSSFPSVTPVCTSEITTGRSPEGHWISGMNWYYRAERRYVEYGSSFEATRTFGLFRSLYDTVYNMNMAHLSDEAETIFERLADHGVRTACTPFLIYRGRTRHELGLEGLLRRVALAATFRHATWGPDELFYGELYSSRKVPCKPTLARPGTRDEYSACCGRELVENDLYDFLLFSLPDNDYHSHKFGPDAQPESIARADDALAELVDAAGGLDRFLAEHAVIVLADHAQTDVEHPLPLAERLGSEWRVLQPNQSDPERAELAVCPSSRAAAVYVLGAGRRAARIHGGVRDRLRDLEGIDLFTWLEHEGEPVLRGEEDGPPPAGSVAVLERSGSVLRFRPGSQLRDRRGAGWELDGDPAALAATVDGGNVSSETYPDGLARLWNALNAPHAGEFLMSADPGHEFVDWGGMTHCPGGSHGALHVGDSLGPLLLCGFDPGVANAREQWAIRDVADLVLGHFGVESDDSLAVGAAVGEAVS